MKVMIVSWAWFLSLPLAVMAQPATVTYMFDEEQRPADVPADITQAEAHVRLFPEDKRLAGWSILTVVPLRADLDSLSFKTYDMVVRSVVVDEATAAFHIDGSITVITPGQKPAFRQPCKIRFEFESPSAQFTYIGWHEYERSDRRQLWTTHPFGWIPLIHERDLITADLFITCDQTFQVFANGVRVLVENNPDQTATWHYRMDRGYPMYLTTVAVGAYQFKMVTSSSGTPIELWMYQDKASLHEPTYRHMRQIFDFIEAELGVPYPYPVYRQAPLAEYTVALECTTATVFSERWLTDERSFPARNYVNINAHELTHQWFGCCVVHRNDRHKWLSEGFATYYAKLCEKELLGDDCYQFLRLREWDRTFQAAEHDAFPVGHSKGDDARWYSKGSLVLDMLRDVLGDTEFRAAIQRYLTKYAFEQVETNDLLKVIHETTGRSLDWFFEEWLYRGGEPHYEVSYVERDTTSGQRSTHVRVRQIHETNALIGPFRMPIAIEVVYRDATTDRRTEWIADHSQEVVIPNAGKKEIAYVLFDPNRRVLKKLTFSRSAAELLAQAQGAVNLIDRYDALVALREVPVEIKRSILQACYRRETFHLNKAEIIRQLAPDPESVALIKQAILDPDPLVRAALLENVRRVPNELKAAYEELLRDLSYDNVALALENLCRSFPQEADKYLARTREETGLAGHNVRLTWLEMAVLSGQGKYADELIAYASPRYDYLTRLGAIHVIKRLNLLDDRAANNLLIAYLYGNSPVQNAAGETLRYFQGQPSCQAVIDQSRAQETWRAEENERLDELLGKR